MCKTGGFNQPTDPKHNLRELVSPEHLQIHHTKGELDKEARPRHPDSSKPFCSPLALRVHNPGRGVNTAVAKRWRGTSKPAATGTPGLLRSLSKGKPKPFLRFRGPLTSSPAIPGSPSRLGFLLAAQKPFQSSRFSPTPPMAQIAKLESNFEQGQRSPRLLFKPLLS